MLDSDAQLGQFPQKLQAILLTGGNIKKLPPTEPKVPGKGYIDIGGVPMAGRTMQALLGSKRVDKITLVTPLHPQKPEGAFAEAFATAPARDSLFNSLFSGFDVVGTVPEPVLLVAGDLPFLTAEAVDDFVERCALRPGASLWYGFLSQKNSLAKYPTLRHTWMKVDGRKCCGTGLTAMRGSIVPQIREGITRITNARKHPLMLGKVLSWGTMLRIAFGTLRLSDAEAAMSRQIQAEAAGIESPFAETAFNVDDLESLKLARELVG